MYPLNSKNDLQMGLTDTFLKIMSMKKHIIIFLTCFFLFGQANSQVNVQDSIILV